MKALQNGTVVTVTLPVTVNLTDVNDNAPVFGKRRYSDSLTPYHSCPKREKLTLKEMTLGSDEGTPEMK